MSKRRILIIDDEPDMVTLLSKGLEANGYEVVTAVNGWDGLAMARIEKPNLILLDSLMPKMDGATTLASLKAMNETKQIPVVVLTALSDKKHITEALQNGASDYIIKPFDLHSLIEKISNILRFGHPQ
jgi:DNA-binding response OmpR family regulator